MRCSLCQEDSAADCGRLPPLCHICHERPTRGNPHDLEVRNITSWVNQHRVDLLDLQAEYGEELAEWLRLTLTGGTKKAIKKAKEVAAGTHRVASVIR